MCYAASGTNHGYGIKANPVLIGESVAVAGEDGEVNILAPADIRMVLDKE